MQGIIKWYDTNKGYGFLNAEGQDYFVHYSGITNAFRNQRDGRFYLFEGSHVEFDPQEGEKGPKAVNVRKIKKA